MAKGEYKITDLTNEEYKAAIAAVKLVRGEEIKNTFYEGFYSGFEASSLLYRGSRSFGELDAWERSHAKFLHEQTHDR